MLKNIRPLHIVLTLSLAVNLIILGAAGYYGLKWRNMGDRDWIGNRLDRAQERVLGHLQGADRELARAAFDARRPIVREALGEIAAARRDLARAFDAKIPQAEALKAAFDRSQAGAAMVNEQFHGLMRDLAGGLSPEARARIARHMRHHHDND